MKKILFFAAILTVLAAVLAVLGMATNTTWHVCSILFAAGYFANDATDSLITAIRKRRFARMQRDFWQ